MPPNTTNAATRTGHPRDRISAERVGRVNADAHDVAWSDLVRVERLERLVNDDSVCRSGRVSPPPARTTIAG